MRTRGTDTRAKTTQHGLGFDLGRATLSRMATKKPTRKPKPSKPAPLPPHDYDRSW